ncbi:MAG: DUF4177 domain-containing protein [Firmicutes bacterium]|jgi:hypothetical protein|nr:DUF4177 domain-containing protein [Bacillota bacterium]NLL88181.1 DUF4177 domain-containing protein [Bacillota bacterium]HKM17704.1 DUF4177 domain-containing protein [Limnochordia bacterium]
MANRTQWEYKTFQFETKGFAGGLLEIDTFTDTLNEAGRDGWEVVSCFVTNQGYGASRLVIVVLKRPR